MLLRTDRISLRYGDGDTLTYAVRSISIEVPATGFFGIMGPSGSGKSSLLYLMSGLKQPTEGSVYYDNRCISTMTNRDLAMLRRNEFGFVFQQPFLLNYLTARENVLTAVNQQSGSTAAADEIMSKLSILQLAERAPAHLSGGEKQRIAVARAMINRPRVIFADEPTAALDRTNGLAVMELLKSYRDEGLIIVVTHDEAMLAGADNIYHMEDGQLHHIARPAA
jgi:putative ABC transport system ATP-binding protein